MSRVSVQAAFNPSAPYWNGLTRWHLWIWTERATWSWILEGNIAADLFFYPLKECFACVRSTMRPAQSNSIRHWRGRSVRKAVSWLSQTESVQLARLVQIPPLGDQPRSKLNIRTGGLRSVWTWWRWLLEIRLVGRWSEWFTGCRGPTVSTTTSHPPLGSLSVFTQLICTLKLWSMTCRCLQLMLFDMHCKGWAGDDCSHRFVLLASIIARIFFFFYIFKSKIFTLLPIRKCGCLTSNWKYLAHVPAVWTVLIFILKFRF